MHTKTISYVFPNERCLRFTLPAGFNAKRLVDLFLYIDLQPLHIAEYTPVGSMMYTSPPQLSA